MNEIDDEKSYGSFDIEENLKDNSNTIIERHDKINNSIEEESKLNSFHPIKVKVSQKENIYLKFLNYKN